MKYFIQLTKATILIVALFLGNVLVAQNITTIQAHDDVDMTWNGAYDHDVTFPDGSQSYRKVLMHYDLGCSSTGCSGWDYTTRILLMNGTGMLDSNVTSIDTMNNDTTWNVFEVKEPFEMARVITPYGTYMRDGTNGYDNDWQHDYVFDVTDFLPLLKNEVTLRAFYDGWENGFSATIWFEFIEGTPIREVKSIQNLYTGRMSYTNSADFEANKLPARTVSIPSDVESASVRITTSGHGFDNSASCAEFCQRSYLLETNGTLVDAVNMWRNDCGKNPIKPQGGTWLYNRADWCPGTAADVHLHDVTDFITVGQDNEIDLDIQSYNWSGNQTPYYYIETQLVTYGAIANTNDAEVIEILSPSNHENNAHFNPICGQPKVRFRNIGSVPMTSLIINYGLVDGNSCSFEWTGNVASMETVDIELPAINWGDYTVPTTPKFWVNIATVNGATDENDTDNYKETAFEMVPILDMDKIVLLFKTNSIGSQTGYRVLDANGDIVVYKPQGTFFSNVIYRDTINLTDGCYTLDFFDTGNNGLSWWANNEGAGFLNIRGGDGSLIESVNPDFGSQVYRQFIIGSSLEDVAGQGCMAVGVENILEDKSIKVFPNPNDGTFTLDITLDAAQDLTYKVINVLGQVIIQNKLDNVQDADVQIQLGDVAKGVYFMHIETAKGIITKEFVVE